MCTIDPETREKLTDCGHCGCGLSSEWGQHTRRATGETVKFGDVDVPTYKCRDCGLYLF